MSLDLGTLVESGGASILNELLAPLRDDDGYALPSRYEVTFHPPRGVRGSGGAGASMNLFTQILTEDIGGGATKDVSYQCSKVNFPSITLTTTADENIYGPPRHHVSSFDHGEVETDFYCHNDMREKNFFDTWQRIAFNPQTWALGYYDDYVGNVQIYSLGQDGNRRYGVELVEAFPTVIGAQALSGEQSASVMTVGVTFKYRYWKNLTDAAELPKPLLDRLQGVIGSQVERTLLSKIPKVLSKL